MRENLSITPDIHRKHSYADDVYGIALGVMFFALGLQVLHFPGLITGGVAGMALLISWFTPIHIGYIFIIVNIPFIAFSMWKMGRAFTLKTIIVNLLLMSSSLIIPHLIAFTHMSPLLSAIVGGTMIGVGILFLARHNASAGGTVVLTLWIQKKYGVNAGKVQMMFDAALFLIATIRMPPHLLLWSLLSGIAMNGMIIAWHKPGRYMG